MVERKLVNKIITMSLKVLFSALFVIFFFSYMQLEANKKPEKEIEAVLENQRSGMKTILAGGTLTKGNEGDAAVSILKWPPKMNQSYPDLELLDKEGRVFKLSDLKGYVIVTSYVDMSSPVSQAQAGSALTGAYGTTSEIDRYTKPFSVTVRDNAENNFSLPNDSILEVYILIYNQDGSQATLGDADKWAEHFDLDLSRGVIVAVPKEDLRSDDTQKILTGYQLIDQYMMLRVDSAGKTPKHNLRMTLIPLLSKLVR